MPMRPDAWSSEPRSRMKLYPASTGTTTASTFPGEGSSSVRITYLRSVRAAR